MSVCVGGEGGGLRVGLGERGRKELSDANLRYQALGKLPRNRASSPIVAGVVADHVVVLLSTRQLPIVAGCFSLGA